MSGRPYSAGSSGNGSYGEPYHRREGYERGGRGRGGYVRDSGRGDYRGGYRGSSYRGGRGGGYQSGYHGSYNSQEYQRDSYSSPSAAPRHNSDSFRRDSEPRESEDASASTQEAKRNSLPEVEGYNRSSRDDFRGGYRGGRGSYRGSYRGGYKPRDGYIPYRRESYAHGPSTPNSRANSLNGAHSYHDSSESNNQSPHRVEPEKKSYKSPWIQILKLDAAKFEDSELNFKLKEVIEEQEAIYADQEKIENQIKEQKIKNLKIQMELGVLKACAEKDALNVELTQEKLDTISFL